MKRCENPYAAPQSLSTAPPKSSRRGLRLVVATAALGSWLAASMGGASANTSWEHHPFGGPFVLLKESLSLVEFGISLAVLLLVLAPVVWWVIRGAYLACLLALLAAAASICFSLFAAWSAAV